MSPSVGNFVHDLVEMAKAMEELPQVRHDLEQANRMNSEQGAVIASREESILKLKAEIEALNNRVRDAEVARDDAELRFLELDEKAGKVLSSLGNIQANLNDAINGLTPPKPEPQPVPEPKAEPVRDTSADWFEDHDHSKVAAGSVTDRLPPQGQSESNPTATETTIQSQGAPTPNAETTASADTTIPLPKPYSGMAYYDHPTYVSLQDWIEGGGTEENYYRSKPRDYSAQYDIPPDEPKF